MIRAVVANKGYSDGHSPLVETVAHQRASGPCLRRVHIWTVSKYGPAADALALDRGSVGEWPWATCRGGSVAAASSIDIGEAARPWWVGWCVVGCRVAASFTRGKLDYFS